MIAGHSARPPLSVCFGGGGGFGIDFETVATRWEEFAASGPGRWWIDNSPMTESMFQGLDAAPGTDAATVALRLPWLRRHVLSLVEHSLPDVVSASSSPIPFARPHRV